MKLPRLVLCVCLPLWAAIIVACKNDPPTKFAAPTGTTSGTVDSDGWVELSPGTPVTLGAASISIREAWFPITGDPEGQIEFKVGVSNTSDTKLLSYSPWSADRFSPMASLKDEHGNSYKRFVKTLPTVDIHPKASRSEDLTFTKPVAAAKWLLLELPGQNVGEDAGAVRIKMSIEKWTKSNATDDPGPKGKGKKK